MVKAKAHTGPAARAWQKPPGLRQLFMQVRHAKLLSTTDRNITLSIVCICIGHGVLRTIACDSGPDHHEACHEGSWPCFRQSHTWISYVTLIRASMFTSCLLFLPVTPCHLALHVWVMTSILAIDTILSPRMLLHSTTYLSHYIISHRPLFSI